MVNERADTLRKLPFQQLKALKQSTETITLKKRQGTIAIIVNQLASGGVLIVVQGFLKWRLLPRVWTVGLDGFYKYSDETMAPMTREDEWTYD